MSEKTQPITLNIDGRRVHANPGDTVLDAARRAGIHIPTLCAHEDLSPFGSCRLCIVEIEGVRGYPTSCTTPATNGMVVQTHSEEIEELRANTLELMLTGHPNSCLVCDHRVECERFRPVPTKAGNTTRCGTCSNRSECSIREMSIEATVKPMNLPRVYTHYKVEREDPFIERNHNLCVLCGRCWRICEQLHGTPFISIINRGHEARIGTAFDRSWVESGCTFCGACVDICPTGTLTDQFARWYPGRRREAPAVCMLCPQACSMQVIISEDKVIETRMTNFKRPARLCALGRFAYPQVLASKARLLSPLIRENGDLTPVDWDEALATAAAGLVNYRDGSFAVITGEPQTREVRWMYERLAKDVMQGQIVSIPAGGGTDDWPGETRRQLAEGHIKALWVTGNYVPEELLDKVEYLVVTDFLPTPASRRADVFLPAAVLAEVGGSVLNPEGEIKRFVSALPAKGSARAESAILADLVKAMGQDGLEYPATNDSENERPVMAGEPRDRLADLPTRFRGHLLADSVPSLKVFGLPATPVAAQGEQLTGFLVVEREEIAPNFHRLVIEAPAIARHAKPGQFAIVMVNEKSERVPFTLVDWDAQKGTVTLVIEEVGRSSQETTRLWAGQRVAHASGPLGLPLPINKVGTVVLGGGCYGIGAIFPMARALKQAGNKVIGVIEGCSAPMVYWEKELRGVCDQLYIATKDGSLGRKGGVQEVFVELHQSGMKIDQFIAIGCTFMMREVARYTAGLDVPLQVALNPIMVDGTGMCGACRVTIGTETKFACVDGPLFDGHLVNWEELASRRSAYLRSEVEALPQNASAYKRATLNILEETSVTGAR